MKNIMIVSALVLSIAGMSTAQADPQWRGQNNQNQQIDNRGDNRGNDHGNDHGNRQDNQNDHGYRQDNRNDYGNRHDNRGNDRDRYDNGNRYDHGDRGNHYGWNGQRYHAPNQYVRPYGYQVRTWRNGDRLPSAYRGSQYYVDYRQYHLNTPPRGYQYVRVNNDVILAAIATGVIASVITGLYY